MNRTEQENIELIRDLNNIEVEVLTENLKLSDAIRLGAQVTEQAEGWGDCQSTACGLSAAVLAAKAFGVGQ